MRKLGPMKKRKTLQDYDKDYAKLQKKFNEAVKNKDKIAIKDLIAKMEGLERPTKLLLSQITL